ncbi:MAG TPA: DNA N-6-adenine-methyltransferase [Phycisphaerae bacterium]|nr:DNA N-6-adenine-methyltransferase [Phycisphaerae bacterium]HPS53411.1 DNA N-6-adenine-methyltransferase [Phycisphaerae bacterium]
MRDKHLLHGFTHENPVPGTCEWFTPPWLFEAMDIEFDLDPASPGKAAVPWIPAREHFTLNENGLVQPWHGNVWLNPPYGRQTPVWLKKILSHGRGIALVFARTDTRWFHETAVNFDAICFLRKRINFIRHDGSEGSSPGCGSMLLVCGRDNVKAVRKMKSGITVEPQKGF